MKKVLLLLAAAATAMILFSCEKTKKQPIEYTTPIYQDLAAKYEVATGDQSSFGIRSFETTSAGLYIIEKMDGRVISGKFEKESVNRESHKAVLKLKGYGKVEIEDPLLVKAGENSATLVFTPEGQSEITVTAEPVPTTSAASEAVMSDLNRTWKVTATTLTISEYSVSYTQDGGCDIPAILKYLEGKIDGFKADKDYTGYVVKDLTLTDNSIIVRFTGADAFSAPITIGANLGFEYEVEGKQVGNPLFNGKATGNISFDEQNKPLVVVRAVIKDNAGKEYNGSVKFFLEEVKEPAE